MGWRGVGSAVEKKCWGSQALQVKTVFAPLRLDYFQGRWWSIYSTEWGQWGWWE